MCLDKMYSENTQEKIKTVKELKKEIPELSGMCKKCGAYYMNPRNKSLIKYDLMMGKLFEDILMDFFKKKLKINALPADKTNKKYPDCMILKKIEGLQHILK